jgi:aminoglycoside phosphotransferase family enzyme/predicted kinase
VKFEAQEQLVSFLESPASYAHRPSQVRSLQTHISWVFVASPFVFKMKKPVNLGFLDFSTLEKRRHFCQREIELNRRLCPEVYLGVLPIYRSAAGLSFEADGEIVEYCVKMKELPDGGFLRELVAKRLVSENEISRVLDRLCVFYESQQQNPENEGWATPEKLRISTQENFSQVQPFIGKTISPVAFEVIRYFTNNFYTANERLFHERIRQHRIRDCHGDLHLDHIHLTPEATTIFDCIEFNDRFRFIDIANDLAFLAMDFDFEDRSDLANLLLQNAAYELRDKQLLRIADFYKCYRALVRGKVESIQANSKTAIDVEEHQKRAARYFQLALRYAVSGSEPLLLVVMGRVGTGKTTVANELGRELDWPVFSSDQIRKTLAVVPLSQRTAEELREKLYSEQMTEQTYRKLLQHGLAALRTHHGAILDATFSSRSTRDFLRTECTDVRVQVIELEAEHATIENRLKAREQSVNEVSDARLEDFEKLSAAYESPSELAPSLIKISANTEVIDSVKAALLKLAERQSIP